MSFKKCQVVMLSTKEKAKLHLNKNNDLFYELGLYSKDNKSYGSNQHLYITSDDEIKEGDWFINADGLWQCNNGIIPIGLNPQKIIATTDKSLTQIVDILDASATKAEITLPQPSQAFIEKYVEQYNKGNVITDVLVEYDDNGEDCYVNGEKFWDEALKPKVSKDNTITIKRVKDSWNGPEIVNLVLKMQHDYTQYKESCHYGPSLKEIAEWTDKWIEENL